jgi:hypothetical protein
MSLKAARNLIFALCAGIWGIGYWQLFPMPHTQKPRPQEKSRSGTLWAVDARRASCRWRIASLRDARSLLPRKSTLRATQERHFSRQGMVFMENQFIPNKLSSTVIFL